MIKKEKCPQRWQLPDEEGRTRTLAQGRDAWLCLSAGADSHLTPDSPQERCILLLGLGPEAGAEMAAALPPHAQVLWVESPDFMAGMEAQCPGWQQRIPAHWREVAAEKAAVEARGCQIWFYSQNLRLFPAFWGPVLGAVQAELLRGGPAPTARASVLLPGGAGDLLHGELVQAFAEAGFDVHALPTGAAFSSALRDILRQEQPALCLAVNGRGLADHDTAGVNFALLRACGVPVALWLVDNAWHILSAWRQAWWRGAHIFVTDASFIPTLTAAGAAHTHHLPLAAAPHMWQAAAQALPDISAPLTFVGRASFPGRDKFFAAASVPDALRAQAFHMLDKDETPHFHWWAGALGIPLWPGHAVRTAGLGAEECSQRRRAQWLAAALPCGLGVYGCPEEWQTLLPTAPAEIFHPAVDYYGSLPALYAASPYSLNVTSLLLPAGLTQRHFDVWAAGGFLLSDATPGLDIFLPELVAEMRVDRPSLLPPTLRRLENSPAQRHDVATAWREHIRTRHTYSQRVRQILEHLGL